MIEIIPAIMPKSLSDLRDKMSLVSGLVPMVQVDIMDGAFVPNKTWPYIRKPDPDFARILKEEDGFPYWQELDFEADLMVSDPDLVSPEWISVGAKRIIIHVESTDHVEKTIQKVKKLLPMKDSFLYTEVGVALNPATDSKQIEPLIDQVDFVQCMGIAKIGFQGQEFDERVLEKIARLRSTHPNVTISVDGGVSLDTAPALIEAGANRLVVGSAIFGSENISKTIEEFLALAN